jgi:hypothetical protein
MEKLTLEFTTQLKDQLIENSTQECLPMLENLEVRAKGYFNFFGGKAVPFSPDDYFSNFMLARYNGKPFLTVKFSPFNFYKDHSLKNPVEQLYTETQTAKILDQYPDFKQMGWSGGFTYIPIDQIETRAMSTLAKELSAFFLYHSLISHSPKGVVLTANLKANIDVFLEKCGFVAPDIPTIIHNELNNNPAKLLILKEASDYMLSCYQKYIHLITNSNQKAA